MARPSGMYPWTRCGIWDEILGLASRMGGGAFTPAPRHLGLTCPHTSSPQIDLLIQETSRLLQLTLEHDPHDTLGHGLGPEPSPLASPALTPSGEAGTSSRQKPVL